MQVPANCLLLSQMRLHFKHHNEQESLLYDEKEASLLLSREGRRSIHFDIRNRQIVINSTGHTVQNCNGDGIRDDLIRIGE